MDCCQISIAISEFADLENMVIYAVPDLKMGFKITDYAGDYMVVFYDRLQEQIMYFFKGAEEYWFQYDV